MKISNETIEVLKNFATINTGIAVKQGDVLHTISPQKNIVAKAKVAETFPLPFAIYDLTNLLGVISMYKEGAEIEFHEKELAISGYGGRSHIHYRYTEKNLIITPPEKEIVIPNEDVSFELSSDDLTHIQRAAGVLQAPQLVIEGVEGQHEVALGGLGDDDHALTEPFGGGAAQQAFYADGLIQQIGTGLALEAGEAVQVEDVGRAAEVLQVGELQGRDGHLAGDVLEFGGGHVLAEAGFGQPLARL